MDLFYLILTHPATHYFFYCPAMGFLNFRGGGEHLDLILERYYLLATQSFGEKTKKDDSFSFFGFL
jgi:hypothetical protein